MIFDKKQHLLDLKQTGYKLYWKGYEMTETELDNFKGVA